MMKNVQESAQRWIPIGIESFVCKFREMKRQGAIGSEQAKKVDLETRWQIVVCW